MGNFKLIVMKLLSSLHKFVFERLSFEHLNLKHILILWICTVLSKIIINVAVYMYVACAFSFVANHAFPFVLVLARWCISKFLKFEILWCWWVHQTNTAGMINQSWNNQLQLATDMHSYISLDIFIKEVDGGHVLLLFWGGLPCWADFGSQRLFFW